MYGEELASPGRRPDGVRTTTRVRVTLRDGREMEGTAGNFTWVQTLGSGSILTYRVWEGPEVAQEAPRPRADPIAKVKRVSKAPSKFETISRCLPEDFLWGDPFTPEVAEKILTNYERIW